MYYDGEKDRLQCDYCGSSFTVNEIEKLLAGKTEAAIEAAEDQQEAAVTTENAEVAFEGEELFTDNGSRWDLEEGMMAYNCPSCGAELICDETTAAMSCPYCDNPTIVPTSIADALKPDLIIPFKLDKEAAKAALREHMKGKKLLPKVFSNENHIDEVKGVYVPFWLYNGVMDCHMTFNAQNVRQFSHGDEIITETDHYQLVRNGTVTFSGVPADASSKMPDEYMDAIEPFDYSQLKDFDTMYLAGYMADSYDVDAEQDRERGEARMKASAVKSITATVTGFSAVSPISTQITKLDGAAAYAFLPVWLLSTQWNGETYLFAVNGQSGKIAGDLPSDKGLAIAWFLRITFAMFVVVSIVLYFIGGGFL